VSVTGDAQTMTLLASVPLTNEDWQPIAKNTILVLSEGEVVATG
jgi:predicted glutamine amidotransferase